MPATPPPAAAPPHASANPSPAGPSPLDARHRRGRRFFNPWNPFPLRPADVLRWYLERPRRRPPEQPAPQVANDGAALAAAEPELALTWVGHSTFALHHERCVLLTDPHFGLRALVPARQVPPGFPLSAVPPGPVVVVSHAHYDHLDRWTARRLPADTQWLVPLGLAATLRRWGARRVRELDWWDEAIAGPWRLTCVPVQHWSRRIGQPRDGTLWCGWLIEGAGRRILFAGDTGWFPELAELGRRCAPLDAALLPIGAYEPRWFMRYQHLDPAEAIEAFQSLRAQRLVAMHWGTFVLTDEPLDEPPRALRAAADAAGVAPGRLATPAVGGRVIL